MEKAHFGMIGLGTMGRNFLLNIAEHGIRGVGFDLDAGKRELLLKEGEGMPVDIGNDMADFLAKLESPRNIMMLVPAGQIVDSVIAELVPQLDKDDLIIDGGNSHFTDTDRRIAELDAKGIGFMGIGVSGGEEGARHGASIMPGGRRDFYDRIEKTLQAVSAKVNGEPCVEYMGSGSAGHFVKMVHNGIEYGLMQIIAETYDFMRRVLDMDYGQMSGTFAKWNDSELNSFLIEITAEVLKKIDAETGEPLVEVVLDKAAQKGTGKWTSQAALDLGVPIPTIDTAVSMRQISAFKETRELIAKKYGVADRGGDAGGANGDEVKSEPAEAQKAERTSQEFSTPTSRQHGEAPDKGSTSGEPLESGVPAKHDEIRTEMHEDLGQFLEELKNALLCSFIVTYSQGMSMLQSASKEMNYGLDLASIAKIWRGGCIIRSALLEEMRRAFSTNEELANLILDEKFAEVLHGHDGDWHDTVRKFGESRIPSACLASAIGYFDAFRTERLPANLIQAQRDFFGAHTYQRVDKEGIFHTPDWDK